MLLVRDLRADHLKAYRPLVIGQAALTFFMVTDVMDELVDMPEPYNMVFEGFFEIVGFVFLVLGLHRWIVYNETLKAQLIRTQLRKTDVFARYGGEEFAILLPQTQLEGALAPAEKVRLALQKSSFTDVGSVTASFGVATCDRDENPDQFLKRVDQSLYEAEASGRNRVVSAK